MRVLARALSAYEAAAVGVDTGAQQALLPDSSAKNAQRGLHGQTSISETSAPAYEVTEKFLYQSYFDTTLGPQALLSQSPGDPIVGSTLKTQQVTGYAVGLAPWSQAPIAISFFTGGQQGGSSPYRLAPGEVVRPHGKPGEKSGAFSGFQFGLPYGWLGGGSVTLIVMRTPDAQVCWNSSPEIIFHRIRLPIIDATTIPTSTTVVPNWPLRFPWPYAVSGTNNLTQRGQPAMGVTPTKVALRLRDSDLSAGPANMRVLMYGTNDFDLDAAGLITTPATTACTYQDLTWGTDFTIIGSVGVGTAQWQSQVFEACQLTRFACDEGGAVICVYDPDGSTSDITGDYVDIIRYGRL